MAGNVLGKEVKNRYGKRPDWRQLLQIVRKSGRFALL